MVEEGQLLAQMDAAVLRVRGAWGGFAFGAGHCDRRRISAEGAKTHLRSHGSSEETAYSELLSAPRSQARAGKATNWDVIGKSELPGERSTARVVVKRKF
jgi:hypothetical protein